VLRAATPERLSAFSDGVFAVLITVLVLDLCPPDLPAFKALLLRWPIWLSYAVSYLFIAIVWANHHHLMLYATRATPRLMWFNFAHLFSVSLLPLSTSWMALSELSPQPVSFYAAVFFLVNTTYILLIWELVDRSPADDAPPRVRRIMHVRSIATLVPFRGGRLDSAEIPSRRAGNLYLLLDRVSEARGAATGSRDVGFPSSHPPFSRAMSSPYSERESCDGPHQARRVDRKASNGPGEIFTNTNARASSVGQADSWTC
jgi:uncharacterized membrane protein